MGKRKGSRRTLCCRRTTRPRLRRKRTIRRRRRGGAPSGTCKTCNRPFATGWAQVALGTHCRGECQNSRPKKSVVSQRPRLARRTSNSETKEEDSRSQYPDFFDPPPPPKLKRSNAIYKP